MSGLDRPSQGVDSSISESNAERKVRFQSQIEPEKLSRNTGRKKALPNASYPAESSSSSLIKLQKMENPRDNGGGREAYRSRLSRNPYEASDLGEGRKIGDGRQSSLPAMDTANDVLGPAASASSRQDSILERRQSNKMRLY